MTAPRSVLACLLLVVLSQALGACARNQSAGDAYFAAATAYRVALDVASTQAEAGLMDAGQAGEFESVRVRLATLLDTWEALLLTGQGEDFDRASIELLLDELERLVQGWEVSTDGSQRNLGGDRDRA